MTEVYGRPHGPRIVRVDGGWKIIGDTSRTMNETDVLWLLQSMNDAVRSLLVDALYGGGRK